MAIAETINFENKVYENKTDLVSEAIVGIDSIINKSEYSKNKVFQMEVQDLLYKVEDKSNFQKKFEEKINNYVVNDYQKKNLVEMYNVNPKFAEYTLSNKFETKLSELERSLSEPSSLDNLIIERKSISEKVNYLGKSVKKGFSSTMSKLSNYISRLGKTKKALYDIKNDLNNIKSLQEQKNLDEIKSMINKVSQYDTEIEGTRFSKKILDDGQNKSDYAFGDLIVYKFNGEIKHFEKVNGIVKTDDSSIETLIHSTLKTKGIELFHHFRGIDKDNGLIKLLLKGNKLNYILDIDLNGTIRDHKFIDKTFSENQYDSNNNVSEVEYDTILKESSELKNKIEPINYILENFQKDKKSKKEIRELKDQTKLGNINVNEFAQRINEKYNIVPQINDSEMIFNIFNKNYILANVGNPISLDILVSEEIQKENYRNVIFNQLKNDFKNLK